MLATLSREIRANLNGIMGSADLLIEDAASRLQREHLTTLRSSAEALHMSLNDVLDYASIETGRIHVAREDYDLRQPLYEVIEQLLPLASLKSLDLVLILSGDQLYRMDFRKIIDEHVARKADVTIATIPVPISKVEGLGLMQVSDDCTIQRFVEKPKDPAIMAEIDAAWQRRAELST